MKKKHELKTKRKFFLETWMGVKDFEVRKNDRDYKVGDDILLMEQDEKGKYSGFEIMTTIVSVLDDGEYCKEGYVVIGIRVISKIVTGVDGIKRVVGYCEV